MSAPGNGLRDRIRAQLADLKMPGALEAVDDVLAQVDSGVLSPAEAIERLLVAQIGLPKAPPPGERHAHLPAAVDQDPGPVRLRFSSRASSVSRSLACTKLGFSRSQGETSSCLGCREWGKAI